jgi:SH3-like domain-containing protein
VYIDLHHRFIHAPWAAALAAFDALLATPRFAALKHVRIAARALPGHKTDVATYVRERMAGADARGVLEAVEYDPWAE